MNLTLTTSERRLQVVLRGFVVLFAIAVLIYGVTPFAPGLPILGPYAAFMRRLPFVAFSVVKVFTLMLVCLYAAGDVRGRLGLVWVAVGGHAISIVAMGGFLVLSDTSAPLEIAGKLTPLSSVLWGATALDGAILVILLGFGLPALQAQKGIGPQRRSWTAPPPKAADRLLQTALLVIGIVFVAGAVAYELGGLLPATRAAFTNVPFVTNSVVKVSTLALVAFYVARDVVPRIGVVGILYIAHVISVITQLGFWLGAGSEPALPLPSGDVPVRTLLLGGAMLDGGIAAILLILWRAAYGARFRPRFLSLRGFRTLVQLADVVVHGPEEPVDPAAIARNVDNYFSNIRSTRGRFSHRLALFLLHFHPLLYLKPPFPELGAADRMHHLKIHFYRDVALKIIPDAFRRFVAGFIKVAKQIAYVGYYSDPAVEPCIGYERFSQRQKPAPPKATVKLTVAGPADLTSLHEETDICVIGTGAAGSILAHQLSKDHQVLMLERGRFVQPAEFTENEVEMIGKLYDDGVFQQTRDLRFTILQGSCVGGTTVINNAVCFPPPQEVVELRWNDKSRWNAGIDYGELKQCSEDVADLIDVSAQHKNLNPSGKKYLEGIEKLGLRPPELEYDVVRANIHDCLGCGYCNTGCAYGRKLSMLDRVLPDAQQNSTKGLRIIAEARVERILRGKSSNHRQRAGTICARLSDGRLLTVRARTVVISAGTIASSWILRQSGIGAGLPVGEGLSFNMGAPLTADFGPDPVSAIPDLSDKRPDAPPRLDAYRGLQISHYGRPSSNRGWVFETWWNPPVAQAINMPGWFEQHYVNMRRYPYLMAVGCLVGTESNGRIEPALTGGPDVIYEPTPGDRRKLADALIELGRILFAAGARRVMVNSWNYYEFTSPDQLPELIPITLAPEELALGTGHPQGGNALSHDPDWGVVGQDFRVHGWDNLYVCDASVFPTSLTVNPQLTVMSLARYAAARIAQP